VNFTGASVQVTLGPDLPGAYDTTVVIGYGSAPRKDLTLSMGSITASQLTERPSAINILEGMQGKVAGLSVINNSGRPGGSPSVIIRGAGSINASSNPLYVVDGIVGADPNLLDPHIIQSMDVLKDAAATAIYGARGANGVVIITTRRAKKGISEINFVHTLSMGTLQHRLKLLNSEGTLEMFQRAYAYSNQLPPNLDPTASFTRRSELFTPDGRPYGPLQQQRSQLRHRQGQSRQPLYHLVQGPAGYPAEQRHATDKCLWQYHFRHPTLAASPVHAQRRRPAGLQCGPEPLWPQRHPGDL
jgi:TonB-dependent SusC/RagA subfamily outer membrane receptor